MLRNLYPAVLYLQDGTCYRGFSFFKLSLSSGEVVFNTGMTGYQEIMSDPSYAGQIIVFTYPEIGNTGLNQQDNESNFLHVKGLVMKNISSFSSNWRAKVSFKNYLIDKQVPHIFGIDTRSLTKRLRLFGVTSAALFYSSNDNCISKMNLSSIYNINNIDLVRKVTSKAVYNINYDSLSQYFDDTNCGYYKVRSTSANIIRKSYKIIIVDLGLKFNIIRKLLNLGCNICVVPATCSYSSILRHNPDGIILSNGPGNPLLVNYVIDLVKRLVKFSSIPILGICMGHQVLNIAFGMQIFKLKFGHRGLNHPCGCNKYSEITSQNHGFVVNRHAFTNQNLLKIFSVQYLNLNDFTVSTTFHKKLPIFSAQYHPEASPGPHDSDYLFEVFVNLINMITCK
uniref:Carbamoyl phosphate synthase small chain n=1 Tax=Periphykon beckeri TaxID=2006982 RepID=A0A1Z1M2N4_9FLOR|nr:carbamoyl phosphate synthase small subunit [Periphykon beckeri]ARW60318.1 carbamoyl phosphate synthase small subunit [Periphykon beckeri]